jgi:hypothetical protein
MNRGNPAGIGLAALLLIGCPATADKKQDPVSEKTYFQAKCLRYIHKGFNIAACDDDWVGRVCRQVCPVDDQGRPLNYYPRACAHYGNREARRMERLWREKPATTASGDDLSNPKDEVQARFFKFLEEHGIRDPKATIIIGKSAMGCVDHELCHVLDYPDNPAYCEKRYPCVEDVR